MFFWKSIQVIPHRIIRLDVIAPYLSCQGGFMFVELQTFNLDRGMRPCGSGVGLCQCFTLSRPGFPWKKGLFHPLRFTKWFQLFLIKKVTEDDMLNHIGYFSLHRISPEFLLLPGSSPSFGELEDATEIFSVDYNSRWKVSTCNTKQSLWVCNLIGRYVYSYI